MSREGAMLGGYFLQESDFKKLITEVITENKEDIITRIQSIRGHIANKNIKLAYHEWDLFQREVFKNPTTQLLAILNFSNKEKQTWEFLDEEATLSKGGNMSMTRVDENMKQVYSSDILAEHLSGLFSTVGTEEMSLDEINHAFNDQKINAKKTFLNEIKYGDKKYIYKPAIYGNIKATYYRGKVADAYLQHVGKTHWGDFSRFLDSGDTSSIEHFRKTSVKKEEDKYGKFSFVDMLIESNNATAWYTGGDLIVTGEDGRVIANIQLKTSWGSGENIGNIAKSSLDKALAKLEQDLLSNSKDTANDFYETLKTSTATEALGTAAVNTIYKDAAEALGIKI